MNPIERAHRVVRGYCEEHATYDSRRGDEPHRVYAAWWGEAEAAHRPCARFWGSDGTLCATHNGRFLSPSETRCTKAEAAHREPRVLPDDTVCACLDETGERKVRLYERCERCGAFMLAAEPIAASSRLDVREGEMGWLAADIAASDAERLRATPEPEK